jgi:hypothetical protein
MKRVTIQLFLGKEIKMGYIEFNKDGNWVSFDELSDETKFDIEWELLNENAFDHKRES